jgi:hypothetical protein
MTNTDVYAILFFILLLALGGLFLAINQVLLIRRIEAIERKHPDQDAWDSEVAH